MQRKLFSSYGIVLSRRYHSEADAIITLLTDDYGKISVVAKGIKKLTSRKRGSVEPFSEIKFSAVETSGMAILTETEIIQSFAKIREDLKKISVAYYFSELINKVSMEDGNHENLYVLLLDYLKKLEKTDKLKTLRFNFAKDLLVNLGFWPEEQEMNDVDFNVEKIIEKSLFSLRVGRALL